MVDQVRSTRLKFKGEKTKKKRKREDDGEGGGSSRRKLDEQEPESWVLPENINELRGPTFIMHPSEPPISINFNSTANRIVLHTVDKVRTDDDEIPKLLDRTPTDVSQVWVITRVSGATAINIRTGTGEGKFLSCDAHGIVSADRDARGPQEEWMPVVLPDGMIAFMNVYEKYLGVDEVAGGALQLRGDSEEVGFAERFWVKIQNKYKKEANEEEKKRKEGMSAPPKIDEANTKSVECTSFHMHHVLSLSPSRLHQAWGAGRSVVSTEDKKEVSCQDDHVCVCAHA